MFLLEEWIDLGQRVFLKTRFSLMKMINSRMEDRVFLVFDKLKGWGWSFAIQKQQNQLLSDLFLGML